MSEERKKRRKRNVKWCRFVMFKNGCDQCAAYGDLGIYCEWQRPYRDADGRITAKCANPVEVDE